MRSARQVGKSTLLRQFFRSENIQLLEISLEIFHLNSHNTNPFKIRNLINESELLCNQELPTPGILFLDEEFKQNFISKGILAEQFVAQHLILREGPYIQPSLYYWLRDKHIQKDEIDILISQGQKIIPVEVKAVEGGLLRSAYPNTT